MSTEPVCSPDDGIPCAILIIWAMATSMETTAVFVDYKIKICNISFLSEQLLGNRTYSRTKDYADTHIKIAKDVGIKKYPFDYSILVNFSVCILNSFPVQNSKVL
jgi:hypothetical protein